ncbi:unnamed protein product [Brassicogethes aeneus]|uniref:CRAL-TRIO domain-containing protein n=1 Tax=Brassicogethes aeneus TaxID=1431903 RepID=A0A9P0FD01_BRAAE|nr:unnamed protein product [Brassicogethes aeneus]
MDFDFEAQDVINEGRTSQKAIEEIKTFISNNEDIPTIPDQMIVLFLLSCRNDIEFTEKTIKAYYKCKKNAPEIFDDRDMSKEDLQLALKTVKMASVPRRTEDNHTVHVLKLDDSNYGNFELVPIMKASYMLLDVTQQVNPPDGLIVVIDMKPLRLMHLMKLKIGAIRKYITFLQEGFPIKLKEIHLLNAVYFVDKVMNIVKSCMNSELVDMLKIHQSDIDMNEFYEKHLSSKYLPSDYGGELPSVDKLAEITLEKLKNRQAFFDEEERIRKEICK